MPYIYNPFTNNLDYYETAASGSGGGGTTDHSALINLDYASSGHTGFQPAGDYYTQTEVNTISGSLNNKITTTINAIPASNHSANGPQCDTINAGESITIMDCVYLKSDGEWWKTSASGEATGAGMLVISLESKTDGQPMNVALPGCFIRDDSWGWVVGGEGCGVVYLSCLAGELTQTTVSGTDKIVRIVGHATHTNRIFFNPGQTTITCT